MHTFSNTVRVTTSRPRDHIETIAMRTGDVVGLGHRNQQYPEFLWCASETGRQGWVAETYLEITSPTEAVASRDYDAMQLTVVEGEILDVLDQAGAFVLCRNAGGVQGWVPAAIIEDAAAHDTAGVDPS